MCEILNVHVQKVDKGMGSIPVSRLILKAKIVQIRLK